MGEPLPQQRPVRQAGQLVMEGLVPELILQCLPLSDVPAREDEPADGGVAGQIDDHGLGRDPRPVGPDEPAVDGRGRRLLTGRGHQRVEHRGRVLRIQQLRQRPPREGLGIDTEDRQRRRGQVAHHGVGVDEHDDVGGVLHQ